MYLNPKAYLNENRVDAPGYQLPKTSNERHGHAWDALARMQVGLVIFHLYLHTSCSEKAKEEHKHANKLERRTINFDEQGTPLIVDGPLRLI
jgi:hypothetical protein